MKLYYTAGDNSLAIRIIIHELGLSYEFESVNLENKITESGKNYFEINPKGQVPALLVNANCLLTENAVIQQYLADNHHATELLPPLGDFNRYRVLEWLNFISTEVHKTFSALYNKKIPQSVKNKIFKIILKRKLDYVDNHLSKNIYLMGNQFTLPDSYLFTALSWIPHVDLNFNQWENLLRYFNLLMDRKSIQKAVKEEHLTIEIK